MASQFNTDPCWPYDGPEFDEFCIDHGGYLPASRDRRGCTTCPLSTLCQAGFEEQVRLATQGADPNLIKDCTLTADELTAERLFTGMRPDAIEFVKSRIPTLR